METFIWSRNERSAGARALANALDIRMIRHTHSRFVPSADKRIINWGDSSMTNAYMDCEVLNYPLMVRIAANKLSFFRKMSEALPGDSLCRTVPWTTDLAIVHQWLSQGATVVAREVLTGSGGAGIRMFDRASAVMDAPLYTQYIKKENEYRVHIVRGEVIAIQRKAKRTGWTQERDTRIRNLANGYIFVRQNFNCPIDVLEQGKRSFQSSGLDFGAIDVLWNERQQQAFVLEINTAPGLEGTTVTDYANAFKSIIAE